MDYVDHFHHLGFFKEFYIGPKFIGYCVCDKDRDIIGYYGRKKEFITGPITLENNKIIKNIEVTSILYPLCGKIKNNQKQ